MNGVKGFEDFGTGQNPVSKMSTKIETDLRDCKQKLK